MPSYADAARCAGDAVCELVHAMEPSLPIRPPLLPKAVNPCIQSACLPAVHAISGWHTFSEEALGWLNKDPRVEVRGGGGCFDDWKDDGGGGSWTTSFGAAPANGKLMLAHCNKLLTWYPAFAGRYTSAWGKFYGPCKEREVRNCEAGKCDYYSTAMWQKCRPGALRAHDAAIGTNGTGHEATPPFVMRALYGPRVRIVSAIRNPTDRLETSFWMHRHYPNHYGASPEGLHKYVVEQTAAFDGCAATHGARRCAYLFELLDKQHSDVFFHCDQLIRGLYEPFVADWHAAFGAAGLLVLPVEDLLDRPDESRAKLLSFAGLAGSARALPPARGYAAMHAGSLNASHAQPMLDKTRELLEAFYRSHNQRLALLLGEPRLDFERSVRLDAREIEVAAGGGRFDRRV